MSEERIKRALGTALKADEILDLRGTPQAEALECLKGRLIIGAAEENRVMEIRLGEPQADGGALFRAAVGILKVAKAEGRIFQALPGRGLGGVVLRVEFW